MKQRKFSVRFVMGEKPRRRVLEFILLNHSFMPKYAGREGRSVYRRFLKVLRRLDVLADFKARVGKEGTFCTVVGKYRFLDEASSIRLMLFVFAGRRSCPRTKFLLVKANSNR